MKLRAGSKNLVILGAASALIALFTTSVSLIIYHYSGDIYIDRSRPGFLPDETELENDKDQETTDYVMLETGDLTSKDLEEYLKNLKLEFDSLQSIQDPFSGTSLSDSSLGIPSSDSAPKQL